MRLLAPQAGELIADLCAAPGGKSMQLAAVAADGGVRLRFFDWPVFGADSRAAALGPWALPFIDEALDADSELPDIGMRESAFAAAHYFNYRKLSIFGGSNEIQKNIISKTLLNKADRHHEFQLF